MKACQGDARIDEWSCDPPSSITQWHSQTAFLQPHISHSERIERQQHRWCRTAHHIHHSQYPTTWPGFELDVGPLRKLSELKIHLDLLSLLRRLPEQKMHCHFSNAPTQFFPHYDHSEWTQNRSPQFETPPLPFQCSRLLHGKIRCCHDNIWPGYAYHQDYNRHQFDTTDQENLGFPIWMNLKYNDPFQSRRYT